MISDEAVEAALEVFWANEDETYLTAMKRALEAAAPFIAAEAWHRGYVSALNNMEFNGATPNPYRSQS